MKKVFLLTLMVFVFMCNGALATDVQVNYNGEKQEYTGIIVDGSTMLPLRSIFEMIGLTVDWNNETKTVTTTIADEKYEIPTDGSDMKVYRKLNDSSYEETLEQKPVIIDGTTYLPLRLFGDLLDLRLDWDNATKTVDVQSLVKYENGQWYSVGTTFDYADYVYQAINSDYGSIYKGVEIGDIIFTKVWYGSDLIMGHYTTYALFDDGSYEILYNGSYNDLRVVDNYVYILTSSFNNANGYIVQVNLEDSYDSEYIGDKMLAYGRTYSYEDGKLSVNYIDENWKIEDGIMTIVGSNRLAYIDSILDKDKLAGNYGYYEINLTTNSNTLVELIDF